MSEYSPCCSSQNTLEGNHPLQRLSYFLSNVVLVVGLLLYFGLFFLPNNLWSFYLYIVAYILLGQDVLLESVKSLWKRDFFNENTLMTIATLGAFFLGQNAEAVGVMLFYKIGELLQNRAVSKSKQNIQALFKLQPNIAHVYRNQNWQEEHPENIQLNEVVLVKKGEKIPLDGIVLHGNSYLDVSSLTGESTPVNISPNDLVYSGTLNLGNTLEIKILKKYEDSSIQKLIRLVEEAGEKKSSTEKFITRFARKYTPIVFLVAFFILIVPVLFFGADWHIWLEKSIIFLVISCPCALVLSVPLSFFSGLGVASKNGILIKSGEYLELLTKLRHIAFDKTGTLTQGNIKLVEFIVSSSMSPKEALGYIAMAENLSSHPISVSFIQEYQNKYGSIPNEKIKVTEITGRGLQTEIQGRHILIGSKTFMEESGVDFQTMVPPKKSIGTFIYLAIQHKLSAVAVIADTLKENAPKIIQELKELGLTVSILSGDNNTIVQKVAQDLKVDDFFGELLPENKVHHIKRLQQTGYTAFVGDGLNDAPSLKTANLGIAMGKKGADLTIEAADIVTVDDHLEKIPTAIQIAHKTLSIARQNIILALGIKFLVMLLTLVGLSNIWEGILADVGVTLLTVLNATRVIR